MAILKRRLLDVVACLSEADEAALASRGPSDRQVLHLGQAPPRLGEVRRASCSDVMTARNASPALTPGPLIYLLNAYLQST